MAISAVEELQHFEKDMDWISKRYTELANKYPEEYVAVYDGEVVGHSSDLNKLMGHLKKKYREAATYVAIQYVSPKKDELIL